MVASLVRPQLLAFWRAPYLGGRAALAAVKGAGVAYALGSAAVIGLVLPDLLGVVALGVSPLEGGGRDLGWKRRVGAYLDAGFLADLLRPQEYFRLVGGAYGMAAPAVDAALERFRPFLGGALEGRRLIRDLSLGNAGIVGALLPGPGLAVLDEPFATLDPGARIAPERLPLGAEATVPVSSHDLDRVVGVCSRVLVLSRGRVVRDTPSRPDTLAELRDFFAAGGVGPVEAAA